MRAASAVRARRAFLHSTRGLRSTRNALGVMVKVKSSLTGGASSTSYSSKFFASIAINIFILAIAR
jgi:hypothetical protein